MKKQNNAASVFPAQPGFVLLCAWFQEESKSVIVDRTPIIAWRLDDFGGLEPIAPTDEYPSPENGVTGILFPDGQVEGDSRFVDEEAWVDEILLEHFGRVVRAQIVRMWPK
jgi:hypothetical protein